MSDQLSFRAIGSLRRANTFAPVLALVGISAIAIAVFLYLDDTVGEPTLFGIDHASRANLPRWSTGMFGVLNLAAAALVTAGKRASSLRVDIDIDIRDTSTKSSDIKELHVRVARGDAGRTVSVTGPDGETTLSPFFFNNDPERAGPALAALLKTSKKRIGRRGRTAVEHYGTRLFNALLPEPARSTYRSALVTAVQNDSRLRMVLDLDDQTRDLPWEYLYDEDRASFLAMSSDTSLVRRINDGSATRPTEPIEELRVLAMTSSPFGLAPLDVAAELNRITKRLAPFADRVRVQPVEGETFEDLRLALDEFAPHIFHFVGHGHWHEESDDGTLAFTDKHGGHEPVSGRDLGVVLNRPGLRLALLNSCDGARTSQHDRFAGVAGSLVAQGVPAAIGMQYAIEDNAAAAFGSEFLAALVATKSIDSALTVARTAIYTARNAIEWGTPVFTTRLPVDDVIPWTQARRD